MSVRFAPCGTLEGSQDATNGVYVTGWAWDRAEPGQAATVAVYDGDRLLGTAIADGYRRDLREAGIGDGHHAFGYALAQHIRDRRMHRITVRFAGTDVTLRSPATGALPHPVSRRDQPPPFPHFSLSPTQRWWYFTALRHLFAVVPFPIWQPLALVVAAITAVGDRRAHALDAALLRALGTPSSLRARWRMHWERAYQQQAELLLLAHGAHLTSGQERRAVRFRGTLPPHGAILVSVHHHGALFASAALAAHGHRIGTISGSDTRLLPQADLTLQAYAQLLRPRLHRHFGERLFGRHEAVRKGLQLLRDGGYLMFYADDVPERGPLAPVLGRAITVPQGAIRFAQRSGRPIIPFMVVPDGLRWRVWLGEEAEPTPQGLCDALERCIRQAPASWQRYIAMAWLTASPWDAGALPTIAEKREHIAVRQDTVHGGGSDSA